MLKFDLVLLTTVKTHLCPALVPPDKVRTKENSGEPRFLRWDPFLNACEKLVLRTQKYSSLILKQRVHRRDHTKLFLQTRCLDGPLEEQIQCPERVKYRGTLRDSH